MITFAFYPQYVSWNAGIAQLMSVCQSWGIETQLQLLNQLDSPDSFSPSTPYVGFSVTTDWEYQQCVPFMKRAKDCGKTVLLGGVWATLMKPVGDFVDYVCRWDGETLPQFLLGGEAGLFERKLVTSEEELNELPLPDYQAFSQIPFDRDLPPLKGKFVLPYVSSRGCHHRCSFCQVRLQPHGQRIRYRVGEDLHQIFEQRGRPEVLYLADSQPPYHNKRWRESWGDLRIPFVCYLRADITIPELEWMIERGMVGCAFGVESGNEQIRNATLHKGVSDSQILDLCVILKLNDIYYMPFFMVGVPGESFLSQTQTIRMARAIGGNPIFWDYEQRT